MPRPSNRGFAYKSSRSPYARPTRSGSSRKPKHGQYINPELFVRVAKPTTVEEYTPVNKFSDFVVDPRLQANIVSKGFVNPTPIQDQTIALGLAGKDVVGIANTGTGKTAAFAVPILNRLMSDPHAKALVVAPTRELAQQIDEECRLLGRGGGFTGTLLIGGTGMGGQLRDLSHKPRMIIGTPGRIKDHLDRGSLRLDDCNMVVLDEVDRMLDMGFVHDVTQLLGKLAPSRQSFFFSATMDGRVSDIIRTFSPNAETVSVKANATSDNVHQDVIPYTDKNNKMSALETLLQDPIVQKVIVFESTQRSVERLQQDLIARGFDADAIHGGKTQGQRQRALDRFKKNGSKILVATDVAARGIDVKDITHVINYGLPQTYDDYTHRIGRAGRAGNIGYALTFVER